MRYGLTEKGRTRPEFFRVVLGPCAQFYPCEASEQKWGQTPKYCQIFGRNGLKIFGGLDKKIRLY